MRGTLNPAVKDITIVGGGVAGLMAAEALLRAGCRVVLHEASDRLGGMIAIRATPLGNVEQAAHSFRTGPAIVALCERLGVPVATAQHTQKFIYRHSRMCRMPLSVFEILGLLRPLALQRATEGGTLAQWARTHTHEAALQALFTPLAQGIYGTTPEDLWQPLAFPRLSIPQGRSLLGHMLFGRRKGPKQPRPQMAAPTAGMGALIDALSAYVQHHPAATVQLNSPQTTLPQAENLILAVPAPIKAKLLQQAAPRTAAALAQVRSVPLVAVTTFLSGVKFPHGIGVLCAAQEGLGATGVLFNSSALPGRVSAQAAARGVASFTFMYGNELGQTMLGWPEPRLHEQLLTDAYRLFGKGVKLEAAYPVRWPAALPRYDKTLAEALDIAATEWCATPGRVLSGNDAGEISLRGLAEDARTLAEVFQEKERLS